MSAVFQEGAATATVRNLPTSRERRKQPLRACVQSALELYFTDLDGHSRAFFLDPGRLYLYRKDRFP